MSQPTEEQIHKTLVLIQDPVSLAKQRLMDFAASLPVKEKGDYDADDNYVVTYKGPEVTYTELINRATAYQQGGNCWLEDERFEGQDIYPEFWDDYALVTKLPVGDRYNFFSCSC